LYAKYIAVVSAYFTVLLAVRSQKAISLTAWKLKSICHRWLLLVKVEGREGDARECPLKVEGRTAGRGKRRKTVKEEGKQ